jgi:hypothetical protein
MSKDILGFPKKRSGFYVIVVENVKGLNDVTIKFQLLPNNDNDEIGIRILMAPLFGESCSTVKLLNLKEPALN